MTETPRPAIPVDDAHTEDVPDSAWDTDDTPERFYRMLEESPEANDSFTKLSEEITIRQNTLAQVRRARKLTQTVLASNLGLDQSAVSRLEHRADMLLSTLRSFIQATGGDLHLIATYPGSPPLALRIGPEFAPTAADLEYDDVSIELDIPATHHIPATQDLKSQEHPALSESAADAVRAERDAR